MATTPTAPTALPAAPDPNDRSTFNARAYPWSVALDPWATQVTAVGTVSYNNAVEAATQVTLAAGQVTLAAGQVTLAAGYADIATTQAGVATAAATTAAAGANLQGLWSALTGALNIPASAMHRGRVWGLLNNLADVTTSEPGVTADWAALSAPPGGILFIATTFGAF